ncbi:MAG: glutathione synthase [SAR324 cluster bacterium]|nr:glutathione synthase [SAR324 cluster bacterium]
MVKVLFVIDPLESLVYERDTSYVLALESQKRGHISYVVDINDISLLNENCYGYVRQVKFLDASPYFSYLTNKENIKLDSFDLILMRKDPPFDLDFFFATQFLSLVKKGKVINEPHSLRNRVEKLYPLLFPGIFPESLISSNLADLTSFMHQYGKVIIKPINDRGGSGVLLISPKDNNSLSALEILTNHFQTKIIIQKYIPEVRQGDLRVFTLNGKFIDAVQRIPADNENRTNLHVGAKAKLAKLTSKQLDLINTISSQLKKDGIYFAGIDVIGDYINEINITSPTGIQALTKVGGMDVASLFWDKIPN